MIIYVEKKSMNATKTTFYQRYIQNTDAMGEKFSLTDKEVQTTRCES